MTAIWSTLVSWLLIRMRRFLTTVENCSTVLFCNVNVCGRVLFSWCCVPSQVICVLSSLSFWWLLPSSRERILGSRWSVQLLPGTRQLVHWYTVVYHLHTRDWWNRTQTQCQTVQTRTARTAVGLKQTLVILQRVTEVLLIGTACRTLAVFGLAGMTWSSWVLFPWCWTLCVLL